MIPAEFELALAEHFGRGAAKYEDRNWERGYRWTLSIGALRRHLSDWLLGQDIDPETGSNHLIAAAWHAAVLFAFQQRALGTDDRNGKKPGEPVDDEHLHDADGYMDMTDGFGNRFKVYFTPSQDGTPKIDREEVAYYSSVFGPLPVASRFPIKGVKRYPVVGEKCHVLTLSDDCGNTASVRIDPRESTAAIGAVQRILHGPIQHSICYEHECTAFCPSECPAATGFDKDGFYAEVGRRYGKSL